MRLGLQNLIIESLTLTQLLIIISKHICQFVGTSSNDKKGFYYPLPGLELFSDNMVYDKIRHSLAGFTFSHKNFLCTEICATRINLYTLCI